MNPREIASVIVLGAALLWGAMKPDIRAAYSQVIKSFLRPKVVGPVVVLAGWTTGLAALAYTVGLWTIDVLSDTVVWFVTAGIALYFALDKVAEDGWFQRTTQRAVRMTVFVEVFVNLRVFSLPVELVLVPVVTFIATLGAFSEGKDEYRPAHRSLTFLLSVIGAAFIVYVTASLVSDPNLGETVRKLLLPVWFTVGVLPLIYAVGLWSGYELAFMRIGFQTEGDPEGHRRAKRAFARAVKWRAADVGGFAGHWIYDLAHAESAEVAREVMRQFRASWRVERRTDRMSTARETLSLCLNEDDHTLADLRYGALRRSWERLDRAQRASLRNEASRHVNRSGALDVLSALPD